MWCTVKGHSRVALVVGLVTIATACEHRAADEWRVYRLSDGGYEMAMPLSLSNLSLPEEITQAMLITRAKNLCLPQGYDLREIGIRKTPQYTDPEKVWVVTCKG